MKNSQSIEIEYIGEIFRITNHLNAKIIEIRQWRKGDFLRKEGWKLIYHGFPEPLREALKFFDETFRP